jgi:hypothetical protein
MGEKAYGYDFGTRITLLTGDTCPPRGTGLTAERECREGDGNQDEPGEEEVDDEDWVVELEDKAVVEEVMRELDVDEDSEWGRSGEGRCLKHHASEPATTGN